MPWLCLLLMVGLASSQAVNETEPVENILGNPCTDKNHLFLAPGVLTAGSMNRACVSRFYTDGPARLMLTLLTEDRQTVSASSQLSADGGCLDINVPSLPNTKADLIVNIRYPEAQCVWERRVPLRISSGRVVVISTERARYRPGELLRLRLLALRQDLAPSHGLIEEVWLEGPRGAWEGSRVTQWQRVRTRLGIAQLQYQLDELAPSGKWTVRAKLTDGSQGSAVFWVGNYELPPFQLSVRHAPRVLRTSDRLVWHVCVRYPWSEAVEGMLVIRLRGAGGGRGGGVRTAVQLRAPRACHRHAAAAKRIGLDGADPPDVVVADFSFQEEGTRIWQNTTVVSQVVDKPISLEFLTKYRAVISPGLPYKLKVKATRWDDKPAPNELVRVCRYPSTQVAATSQTLAQAPESMCAEGATDAGGVAILLFAAGDDAAPFYRFEAHLSNDTTTSAVPLSLPVRRPSALFAALGPLKPDAGQARTFVPLYLNTNITSKPYTVHFVVITRGGVIIRWAATTQCLTSTSDPHVHTAPRNTNCDLINEQRDVIMSQRKLKSNRVIRRIPFGEFPRSEVLESTGSHDVLMAQRDTSSANVSADVSDALLNRHQLRVMLPIKVSHQMCPDSHLIAYFYHEGELISASKHFDMDECFVNKVEATWLTRQAQPGSTVSLQVSTPGPALCGLTVLDTASKWIQPPQSPKEQLMTSLRRLIDSHRNLTEYDLAGVCFLNSDSQDIPSTSIELTASWMAAAGVRLLGGDMQAGSRNCIPRPPALLVAEEATVPRSDFSEAFLWRLLSIGANGTGVAVTHAPDSITRYEASAVCVSRNGVAVSAPAVLQVFREFFIHADSPKRLRRGDSTIIRYRIFNYLYEPLSVQIQILTDPHVEGPKDLVESACVGARASIARRVEIRARVAGPAKIRIRAKAVSDGNCGNVTSGRTGVSDEVVIRITVDPEGVPIREQKSILLCGNSSSESSKSEVLWNWPAVPAAVHGTETLTVWAVGDVTGPLLADADSLLIIPRGCGEQNMAQLATNLLALNQLEPSSIAALTAREHVARGFTRQLQYVHPSGGFSAFGPSDSTSSTWLTAFVVRHMRRAHKVLWPNLQVPPAIIRAERWLLNQQMENGCFRNEGQVFHRELRGGLNDEGEIASVALTAYVITSLIESSSPLPYRVIRNTLSCLRAFPLKKSKTPTRVYAQALLAYAYMKLQDYEEELRITNEASLRRSVGGLEESEGVRQVLELLKIARRSGEYVWWEANSLSTSIEATSYALLALQSAPRALSPSARTDAPAAARWLNAHRTTSGGFISTQDTLVALEALTAWVPQAPDTNLTVTARCSSAEQRLTLAPGARVPDIVNMKPGERLSVSVEGSGCALVQATRSYNVLSPEEGTPRDKQLSVQVGVHTDGPFDCDANGTNCFCAAVIEACVMWTGSFPEMALLEVTLPGGYGADAQRLYSQLHKTTTLLRRIELTPQSTRATFYLGSRDGSDISGHIGHQCYNIHATGPRVKTRPAYAKVQDYYAPSINDTQVYTIPEECPPRIMHETNDYLTTDNLYAKARSADSDDIIITHEFSFDDIPEGIPLDDPLMFDHILNENDNYRVAAQKRQEIGKLKAPRHSKYFAEDVQPQNISDSVLQQHILALKLAELNQRHFDDVAAGYFKENDPADPSISKSKEKNINYSNVVGGHFGISKITDTELGHSGKTVIGKDQTNANAAEHDKETTVAQNMRLNDSNEKDQSTIDFGLDEGPFGMIDEVGIGHNHFSNRVSENKKTEEGRQEVQNDFAFRVGENKSSNINDRVTVNHRNLKIDFNVNTNMDSGEDDTNQNNNKKMSLVPDSSNVRNIATSNANSNEDTFTKDQNYFYSVATENAMTLVETEIKPQNSYDIDTEYQKSELKIEALKNKDESKYDTQNNLVKEIDTLNKAADKQFNATKSQFDDNQSEYKLFDTFVENEDIMNIYNSNHNSDFDSYHNNEGPKSRDKDIKRSYTEEIPLKPEVSEKIVTDYETDLETENEKGVDNPNLADFHVIDTEKDLEVPAGIEGPIPASVLPPPGFVPPAPEPVDARRLEHEHRPAGTFPHQILPPPPKFFVPSKSHNQMKTLPAEGDLSFGDGRPVMFDGLPPSINYAAPSYHGYLRTQDSYPVFSPSSIERAFGTILPPKSSDTDLSRLHSIDTPNGQYFYFQADSSYDANRKYFIPAR
ncbi:hypothetical protein PYW08_005383 [Mythimna loreyi]|uniref:Uncharacterized protein n=1 Tax=Mythimna loreyi TaxID=667449 RepID=A0ACC2QGI7_9NEOP|nr:hypothetical protein PYW08_005383 [Mythimna loreyi]